MPDRYKSHAYTLIEIMIVCGIIGLLAAIAIPSFIMARGSAQKKACIANLRAIDTAKQIWATDNRKAATVTPTAANLGPYFGKGTMPTCPGGGTYTIRNVGTLPSCSLRTSAGHKM